jgi:hypothetical protein
MYDETEGAALASYRILIRSVGQGIREIHGDAPWSEVERRAESLWGLYAVTTGLSWAQVAERVRQAWSDFEGDRDEWS